MRHVRYCPNCSRKIQHKNLKSCKKGVRNNLLCRSCVMVGNKRGTNKGQKRYPKRDLTGQFFNNWKVLGLSHREEGGMWYWDVECMNCGYAAKRFTNYVKNSKGCISCGLLSKGEVGLSNVICNYRDSAKQRGLLFELSKDQVRELTSQKCYYCGGYPNKVEYTRHKDKAFEWGNYVYNGIDRVDNKQGYIVGNCVPCCGVCNRGKGAMKLEEWLTYVKRFAENAGNKQIPCLSSS